MKQPALAFLITFTTYGTKLPGDPGGYVDRVDNLPGSRRPPASRGLLEAMKRSLAEPPYLLDSAEHRETVLEAIQDLCAERGWRLGAAHVRTNHVHVVVEAADRPERILQALKARATRALKRKKLDPPQRARRWTRHGSTRYLTSEGSVLAAVDYVAHEQGQPMALYVEDTWALQDALARRRRYR